MTNKLMPFGAMAAIIIGVLTTLTLSGTIDNDNEVTEAAGGEGADIAALCVEGVEDCDDMVAIDTGEGDDASDELPPANGDPNQPVSNDNSGTDEGEALAIEAAFAELEAMGGPPASEFDVSGVESVTWSDACLGVQTPGIACAEVITPGYIVFLSGAGGDYEFHTDTSGNAVLAPQE